MFTEIHENKDITEKEIPNEPDKRKEEVNNLLDRLNEVRWEQEWRIVGIGDVEGEGEEGKTGISGEGDEGGKNVFANQRDETDQRSDDSDPAELIEWFAKDDLITTQVAIPGIETQRALRFLSADEMFQHLPRHHFAIVNNGPAKREVEVERQTQKETKEIKEEIGD